MHGEITRCGVGATELAEAPWLRVRQPRGAQMVVRFGAMLQPGESEAITLANELSALLLLDDRRARRAAARIGVTCLGTVGVVLEAKDVGLVEKVEPLLDGLVNVGVYLGAELI